MIGGYRCSPNCQHFSFLFFFSFFLSDYHCYRVPIYMYPYRSIIPSIVVVVDWFLRFSAVSRNFSRFVIPSGRNVPPLSSRRNEKSFDRGDNAQFFSRRWAGKMKRREEKAWNKKEGAGRKKFLGRGGEKR